MKVFHHCDMDGFSAGAVVASYENNYNKEDYFSVDYEKELPLDRIKKGERVYLVDYSFSKNTYERLKKILEITNDVIWIDHHKSSIDMLKEHPEFKSVRGIIKEGISGGALTYMYLYGYEYDDIPLFLKYVSDFDCWLFRLPKTMEFKYGMETQDMNPLSDIWIRLFEDENNELLESLKESGTIIKGYVDKNNATICSSLSYEREVEGYKALIINSYGFSNMFDSKADGYDVLIKYTYNGENYSYSIYTQHPDKIDVSKIAEKFGGGGHAGAAGFVSKELLFK